MSLTWSGPANREPRRGGPFRADPRAFSAWRPRSGARCRGWTRHIRRACGGRWGRAAAFKSAMRCGHRVQAAPVRGLAFRGGCRVDAAAFAEQPLEDQARIVLERKRRRRALERQVRRGRCPVVVFGRQLQRRELGLLAQRLCRQLIDGDADLNLALGQLHARHERRQRPVMEPGLRPIRVGGEAAEHEKLLLVRRQRSQRFAELVAGAFANGAPPVLITPSG